MKTQKGKYALAGSAALLTFIAYLATLRNDFLLWDDDLYVTDNLFIRSLDWALLKKAFFDLAAFNWHPLTWLSHALDYAVWGLNPLGHHLTNTLLHAANTFLVVLVVAALFATVKARAQRTGRPEIPADRTMLITAGVTGLLFGLHPIHVESVAWVAERKDVLCALFFLLSILSYTKYAGTVHAEGAQPDPPPRSLNTQYLLSLGFFVLAVLSKPMAITLPVVLLILDWHPFERVRSRAAVRTILVEKLPFIAVSLVSSVLTILAQKSGGAVKSLDFAPFATRLLVGARSLIAYLWKMVMPTDLIPYYLYPKNVSLFSLEYAAAVVLVIGITIASVMVVRKQKVWLAAWGYYLVTLAPVLGIVQVGSQAMADRYSYLPSLGPFALIGLVVAGASAKAGTLAKGRRPVAIAGQGMGLAALALLMYLTVQQIGVWKNSIVFWNYIIDEKSQNAPFVHVSRGTAYEKLGQTDKALADYDRAIALDPSSYNAYNARAVLFEKMEQPDKALADYDRALALEPPFDKTYRIYNNRALLFKEKGQLDKALADFDRAIASNPSHGETYYNRALLHEKKGQLDKALADYDRAIALNPSSSSAYNNRAILFGKKGHLDRALADYDKALSLGPPSDKASGIYNNRALLYEKKGQLDKARADLDRAIASDPSHDEAYYNRALLSEKKGLPDEALADYDRAIVLNPSYDRAYYGRALILDKKGQTDKAIADYDRAIAINPSFGKAYLGRGILFVKAGQFDKAIEYVNRSIALDRNSAEAYGTRGLVSLLMNKDDQALEDFHKALALDPRSAVVLFNRGYLYEKTGKHDLALTDLQNACKLGNSQACSIVQAGQR